MHQTLNNLPRSGGFSLAEMAVVLLILVVLAGGVVVPLTAQIDQRRRDDTARTLAEIREALIGFAVVNKRLPCPSYVSDPTSANYGDESYSASLNACVFSGIETDGFLPWRTLGVPEFDSWGSTRNATSDPNLGHWRYRVDRNFAKSGTISLSPPTTFGSQLDVRTPGGANRLNTDTERPVAVVFSTGANRTADLDNNPTFTMSSPPAGYVAANTYNAGAVSGNFDDIVVWIGRSQLYARMVAAGVLP